MKKYLLTIFTSETNPNVLEDITNSVSHLFENLEGFILLGSNVLSLFYTTQSKSELFEDLTDAIDLDYYFLLTEVNDEYTMELPFNDIEIEEDDEYEIMSSNIFPSDEQTGDIRELIAELGIKIVDESPNPKRYNLDDILDKITIQGINSLTKSELEFLKNQ